MHFEDRISHERDAEHDARRSAGACGGEAFLRVVTNCLYVATRGRRFACDCRGLHAVNRVLENEEIRNIMVRSDSSAQFGDQVARWRVVGDSLWLTLGDGVWQVYGLKLDRERLTLSGGDLEKPVTLRRVGPATARADSVAIPPPPPPTERAWD
jgi:hypothetical protein